jgi:Pyridoxal-phosphate dependent enzyme
MMASSLIARPASWRMFATRALIGHHVASIPVETVATRSFGAMPKVASTTTEPDEPKVVVESVGLKKKSKELEDLPVSFSDISRAALAIRGGVRRTECTKSFFLSELIGANIYIKPEFQQFTGSFKERGARNAILHLMRESKAEGKKLNGVIAASAGNHALALAYHGRELGVPVTVVMPVVAPLAKVDKCRVSIFARTRNLLSFGYISFNFVLLHFLKKSISDLCIEIWCSHHYRRCSHWRGQAVC